MGSLYQLFESHFSEIINVTGTILGVVLGAFISRISRWGRVKFYFNNVEYYTSKSNNYGEYVIDSITPDTQNLNINIELDMINTSQYSKKILRELNFRIQNKDYKKNKEIRDLSTRSASNHGMAESLKIISLQPGEIKNLKLNIPIHNEDAMRVITSDWFLIYNNLNNRKRKVKIKMKKELFENVFPTDHANL